jgi:hypothetical protein
VIDEVLTNIREAFLDEGLDEQILHELKHVYLTCSKLLNIIDNLYSFHILKDMGDKTERVQGYPSKR